MDQAVTSIPSLAAEPSTVVELRQYGMKPGGRDTLAALFEKHFVTGQEALGIRIHGVFRDRNHSDRLVWLRGFRDASSRAPALDAFYKGPVWNEHRSAANATMEDVGDVLLLQPVDERPFTLARRMGAAVVATIYLLQSPVDAGFVRFFQERVTPALEASGAVPVAALKTREAPNDFPALPLREGEHAFVWFAAFESDDAYRKHLARLHASAGWQETERALRTHLKSDPVRLELAPTPATLERNATRYTYTLDRTGSRDDFAFIAGSWSVKNWRLPKRGLGSADWDVFPASASGRHLLGGLANVDEIVFPTKGWSGMTLRAFDVERRQWKIWWINSRDGRMQEPVQGGFEGNVGLFFGEDTDEGRPVKVVYRWTRLTHDLARWEQAFSYDGGRTWETNWVNELARIAP